MKTKVIRITSLEVPKANHHKIHTSDEINLPDTEACNAYGQTLKHSWRIHMNVIAMEKIKPDSITLVAHGDSGRIGKLKTLLQYWTGAVSVSLYTHEEDIHSTIEKIKTILGGRRNVAVHILINDDPVKMYYPSNLNRNIAVNGSNTNFLFLLDLDFIPMVDTEIFLNKYKSTLSKHEVFVIPAFQSPFENPDPTLLTSKMHLRREQYHQYSKRSNLPLIITPFQKNLCRPCHGPTNFIKWWRSKLPYSVEYMMMFEPYVLIHTSDMVSYEEQFIGRFRDKISLFMKLANLEYKFTVLPDVFVIHFAHPVDASGWDNQQECAKAVSLYYEAHLCGCKLTRCKTVSKGTFDELTSYCENKTRTI